MKKIACISLLALMFYNCIGYRLLISYLQERAGNELETQLNNNNYDFDELVSIKIPLTNLPYYTNSTTFERIDGQVEIKGIEYRYVKLRMYNDSIELLCIPDHLAMNLKSAKNYFFTLVNDLQHTDQNKKSADHPNMSKNFSSDSYIAGDLFTIRQQSASLAKRKSYYSFFIRPYFPAAIDNPPERC